MISATCCPSEMFRWHQVIWYMINECKTLTKELKPMHNALAVVNKSYYKNIDIVTQEIEIYRNFQTSI